MSPQGLKRLTVTVFLFATQYYITTCLIESARCYELTGLISGFKKMFFLFDPCQLHARRGPVYAVGLFLLSALDQFVSTTFQSSVASELLNEFHSRRNHRRELYVAFLTLNTEVITLFVCFSSKEPEKHNQCMSLVNFECRQIYLFVRFPSAKCLYAPSFPKRHENEPNADFDYYSIV